MGVVLRHCDLCAQFCNKTIFSRNFTKITQTPITQTPITQTLITQTPITHYLNPPNHSNPIVPLVFFGAFLDMLHSLPLARLFLTCLGLDFQNVAQEVLHSFSL